MISKVLDPNSIIKYQIIRKDFIAFLSFLTHCVFLHYQFLWITWDLSSLKFPDKIKHHCMYRNRINALTTKCCSIFTYLTWFAYSSYNSRLWYTCDNSKHLQVLTMTKIMFECCDTHIIVSITVLMIHGLLFDNDCHNILVLIHGEIQKK